MTFQVSTKLSSCQTLTGFFETWQVGQNDLLVSYESSFISPYLGGKAAPCDVLYQADYGLGEPTDEMIDKMLLAAGNKQYDRIIAIGGGTIIDIAKLMIFGDGLTCDEIFAQGATLPRKRKLIVIPTTCGAGSEVTMISIVRFEQLNTKKGLAVPALFPDEAVLIPSLLTSQLYETFAASSIDALIHSAESYISPKATPFSKAIARDSIERIVKGYKAIKAAGVQKVPGVEEMHSFLVASTMGGIAFGNAGVGAVHALSYPVGAIYHVPHGKANYMFFGAVFSAYKKLGAQMPELERVLEGALECHEADCKTGGVWNCLFELIDFILPRQKLSALGADEAKCKEMAASVVKNQQRLLVNNPIPLTEEQIYEIYLECM